MVAKGGTKTPWKYLMGYLFLAAVHLLYKFAVMTVGLPGFANLLLTYPSPLVAGEAICLFLFFKDAFSGLSEERVLGRLVRFAAPGVYSVYVIHVHPKVYWNTQIIALFRNWDNWNTLEVLVSIIATAAALFAVCVCLDALRQRMFRSLGIDRAIGKLSDSIEHKVRTLLGD